MNGNGSPKRQNITHIHHDFYISYKATKHLSRGRKTENRVQHNDFFIYLYWTISCVSRLMDSRPCQNVLYSLIDANAMNTNIHRAK